MVVRPNYIACVGHQIIIHHYIGGEFVLNDEAVKAMAAENDALKFEIKDAMDLLDKKGMAYWILEQALKGKDDEKQR